LDLVQMLDDPVSYLMRGKIFIRGYTYQDDCAKSGIVCVWKAVDKSVQRVTTLDIVVDAYGFCQF